MYAPMRLCMGACAVSGLSLHFFLGTVGIDDIGVLQLAGKICFYIVNVNTAQLVPLCQLLGGQALGFCLGGQFVDSCDYFIDAHNDSSHIAVNDHRNTALFRLTVDGF